jgi:hypothetical protein
MTDRAKYVERRVIEQQLSEVQFDAYGTPDRKLPDCPLCGEDELYGSPRGFHCYRCSYAFTLERPREPQPPVEIDVTEFLRDAFKEALLRELVLSTLINRAGGSITLTNEQVKYGHGEPVQVHVDPTTHEVTITTKPCARCAQGFPHPVGHA